MAILLGIPDVTLPTRGFHVRYKGHGRLEDFQALDAFVVRAFMIARDQMSFYRAFIKIGVSIGS